jgi:hypothetical protein
VSLLLETFADLTPETTPILTRTTGQILMVEEQGLFSYTTNVPELTKAGQYLVVWKYQYAVNIPAELVTQNIVCPPMVVYQLIPHLQMFIDKLQKKSNSIFAYNEADMVGYYMQAVGVLNVSTPQTNWDLNNFPITATTFRFLTLAAGLVAIEAQQLLGVETNFQFGGQLVTLDMDLSAGYDTVVTRIADYIRGDGKSDWPAAKMGLMKATGPLAVVHTRLRGPYQYQNFVFKVNQGKAGAFPLGGGIATGLPSNNLFGVGWTMTDAYVSLGI